MKQLISLLAAGLVLMFIVAYPNDASDVIAKLGELLGNLAGSVRTILRDFI